MGFLNKLCGIALATTMASAYGADEFKKIHLKDTNNRARSVNTLESKLTLVHFWATWCSSCIQELPELIALTQSYERNDLSLILIAADSTKNTKNYLLSRGITHTVFIDQYGKAMRDYKIKKIPVTFLYDRTGQSLQKLTGAIDWQSGKIINGLNALIAQQNKQ